MAGAFREERMLIKYSNASLSWDTKPNASRPTNMAYTRYFMAVTPPMRKQIKRKNSENGQSEPGF
jgi:hypothetical protein